jgi:hypothetical protein
VETVSKIARTDIPLRDFRTFDCDCLMNEIAKQYSISTTTLEHVKNLLSGIFRYAIRTGSLNTANPIRLFQGDQKVLAAAGQPWHGWQAARRAWLSRPFFVTVM